MEVFKNYIGFINVTKQYSQNPSASFADINWMLIALKKLEASQQTSVKHHKGWYDCDAKDGHKSSSIFRHGSFEWPNMLSHYIKDHNYLPPDSFIALLKQILPK